MINPEQIFKFASAETTPNSDHEIKVSWPVPHELPYFEGHFPGNPILPGVALLDLIQVLLKGKFTFIKSTKFTEVIRPGDILTINAKLDPTSNFWSISVSNQNEVNVCKMSLQIA